jgi:hypothetical protein
MDQAERTRLKQLANDAVIATFGYDDRESRVAEALERCVDELEDANSKCPTCSVCENHGDNLDESIAVDASEVIDAHRELAANLKSLESYRDKLIDADGENDLLEELTELIEEFRSNIDSVEACVIE